MFRYIDKTSPANFAKDATKKLARWALGLDVSRARSRKYDLHTYAHNVKHVTRFMHFQDLLNQLTDVHGCIVECGVGPGLSLFDFAAISTAMGQPRRIYGYDTFEGLPDPTDVDGSWNTRSGGFWNYSMAHVHEELRLAGLDEDFIRSNVALTPGEFKQTLPSYDHGPIALLHIDVDIYESYRTVLECLYDHVQGGIIAFDEYRQEGWPGATKAIDEFFLDKPEELVRSHLADRYYVKKCT